MFPLILNPLPLLLTFSTAFGVLVHDLHIDQFTAVATLPAIVVGYSAIESGMKGGDHIHVEKASASLKGSQPATQPRNEDKKYIGHKRLAFSGYGSEYHWPSE